MAKVRRPIVGQVVSGPDAMGLAFAAVRLGSEGRIRVEVKVGGDSYSYDIRIISLEKPRTPTSAGYKIKGMASCWNHVPMGYGESYFGPEEAVELTYNPLTQRGPITFI